MGIKIIKLLIPLFLLFSCRDDECEIVKSFTFDLEIEGSSDTLVIGDTIKYHLVIPHDAVNQTNNEIYDLSDFDIKPRLTFHVVKDDTLLPEGKSFSFSDLFVLQTFLDDTSAVTAYMPLYKLEKSNEFMGYIICERKGKFVLSITNSVFDLIIADCPDRIADINYKVTTEDFTDNYYLAEDALMSEGIKEDEMRKYGAVVFVVK